MIRNNASGNSGFPARAGASAWKLYIGVLGVFLAVYVATAQRGPAWQDSGIYQWRCLHLDVTGWLGLALSHPLLILLGRAFSSLPIGPLAWRMNLVSAVCGALAVANVALLVRRLRPDRPLAAWLAAGLFGLAHTVWWLATICESQLVLAALFTAELHVLVSLVRRPRLHLVLLLAAVNGLALTAHNLALLALPVYGLVVLGLCARRRLRWWAIGLFAGGWVVGAAGLLVLVAHRAAGSGIAEAVSSALFGRAWQGQVLGASARAVALGAGYVAYNFPNAGLPLAVMGLLAMRKSAARGLVRPCAGLAAIYLAFAIRYAVVDQFMFFLPFYAMLAVLAGVGFARLAGGRWSWAGSLVLGSVLLAPVFYAAAPSAAKALKLPLPGRKDLPFRDHGRYWLSPWKGAEDSAGRFARAALDSAGPDAVIVADSTSLHPLLWVGYARGGAGATVLAAGQATRQRLPVGTPNVFVVSDRPGYYPAWLAEVASFQKDHRDDILFRVVWHGAGPAGPGR